MAARLVYSSGPGGEAARSGQRCARHGRERCDCAHVAEIPPEQHALRLRVERAGRKGKTVTVAHPLFVERARAEALLAELKRGCGSGGALKQARSQDGRSCWALELQGDHAETLLSALAAHGYPAKRAGS